MIIINKDQWNSWAEQRYNRLPMIAKYHLSTEEMFWPNWSPLWEAADSHSVLLESGNGGRYTIFGLHPLSKIEGKDLTANVYDFRKGSEKVFTGKPLDVLREWMQTHHAPKIEEGPPYLGGYFGYIGYDVVRSLESLPANADDDLDLPDYSFIQMDEVWIIDRVANVLYCVAYYCCNPSQSNLQQEYEGFVQKVQTMKKQWDDWYRLSKEHERNMNSDDLEAGEADLHILEEGIQVPNREQYTAAVKTIQGAIEAGEVFQVNLSVRETRKASSTPDLIYEQVRRINPSPYMGLLRMQDYSLVSASPELLVRLQNGCLYTRPIGGTRARGIDTAEDQQLENQLITNEKEAAEHIMLVDLIRNDLGKVAKYGSVHVPELRTIEKYSHVMHIVSEVDAQLADEVDLFDVIAAMFPGGTITGAPKLRTMEWIEKLEPARRGPYTGALGWIGYSGEMEFNIMIRTLIATKAEHHVQAGAGIVIDSVPELEYAESLNKAKALWEAVSLANKKTERMDVNHVSHS